MAEREGVLHNNAEATKSLRNDSATTLRSTQKSEHETTDNKNRRPDNIKEDNGGRNCSELLYRPRMNLYNEIAECLEEKDVCVAYFKLKRIQFPGYFELTTARLSALNSFIKNYVEKVCLLPTDFDKFMGELLMKIRPESITEHIRCIAHFDDIDLDYYRKYFGYSKIYECFTESVSDLYSKAPSAKHLKCLIRLLQNDKLVYKNLQPVIARISKYVEEDLVDSNIGVCCSVLDAIVDTGAVHFSDVIILSLISYLTKILHTPQNFMFLSRGSTDTIVSTIRTLSKAGITDASLKRNSFGLLRECLGKVEEYRQSTIYEEVLVLVCMMEVSRSLFKIAWELGNRNFPFIKADSLNFLVYQEATKKTVDIENSGELEQNVEKTVINVQSDKEGIRVDIQDFSEYMSSTDGRDTGRIHREKAQLLQLQTRFLEAKYQFIDSLCGKHELFDRTTFYSDLSHIPDPLKLFLSIDNLKPAINWSDMIVCACNSSSRASYIPLLFDEAYIHQKTHRQYVELYLDSIGDDPILLLYFAKAAALSDYAPIVSYLFLKRNSSSTATDRRAQAIILEHINQHPEDGAESSEKLESLAIEILNSLNDVILNKKMALLFMVLASKRLSLKTQLFLYTQIKKTMKNGVEDAGGRLEQTAVCICALIINRLEYTIFSAQTDYSHSYDVYIALLNYRMNFPSDEQYGDQIKAKSFEILLEMSQEELREINAVYRHGADGGPESAHVSEYEIISALIRPKMPDSK